MRVGLVWEVLSAFGFLSGGLYLAVGLWAGRGRFAGQQIVVRVIGGAFGILLTFYGMYLIDLARQGKVAQRDGVIIQTR
jgi:hypothetical protein